MPRRTPALMLLPLTVAVALSFVSGAGPASAGGPTSVLLSVPGEGRVAALYHTDPAYDALSDLVGISDPSGRDDVGRSHETTQMVTLTWLIHDVEVWRVDRVSLDGTGGAWVETREVLGERSVWDARPRWHQADRRLTALLTRLLPAAGAATSVEGSVLDELTPEPAAPEQAADPAPSAGGADTPFASVAWGGAGVLAGAAAATALLRRGWRRQRVEDVDGERPTVDQLAWP